MAFIDVGSARIKIEPDFSLFNSQLNRALTNDHFIRLRIDESDIERSINRVLGKSYELKVKADLSGIERQLGQLKLPTLKFPELKVPEVNLKLGGVTSALSEATRGFAGGINAALAPIRGAGNIFGGAIDILARGVGSAFSGVSGLLSSAFSVGMGILSTGISAGVRTLSSGLVGAADLFGKAYLGYLNQGLKLANKSVEKSASVESLLATTQIKVGASDEELKSLKKEILQIAARPEVTATPSDIARGADLLAQSGFNLEQIKATLPTLTLAGSLLKQDVAGASSLVIDLVNKFQLKTDEIPKAINVMASSLTAAKISANEFQTALQYYTPQAKGIDALQETANSFSLITTSGQSASTAGTGLSSVVDALVKSSGDLSNVAKIYSLFNTQVRDSTGNLRSEYEILLDLRKGYQQLAATRGTFTATQKTSEIFGAQGGRVVASLAKLGDAQVEELLRKTSRGQSRDFLGEFAKSTAATTTGTKTSLEGNIESFQIALGDSIAPIYKALYGNIGAIFGQLAGNEKVFLALSAAAERFASVLASPPLQVAINTIAESVARMAQQNFDSIAQVINSISDFLSSPAKLQEFIAVALKGASLFNSAIARVNQAVIVLVQGVYLFLKQLSGLSASGEITNPVAIALQLISSSINILAFNLRIIWSLIKAFSPIIEEISKIVDTNFGGLSNIENNIKSIINIVASNLLPVLRTGISLIGELFSSFNSNLSFTGNPSLPSLPVPNLSNVGSQAQELFSNLSQLFNNIFPSVREFLLSVVKLISLIFQQVVSGLSQVLPILSSTFSNLFSNFAQIISGLIPFVASIATSVIPIVSQSLAFVLQIITSIASTITGLIPYAQSAILGLLPYVQSAISTIYSLILAIISPVGQLASALIPLISQGLAFLFQVITSIASTITGLIPYVQSAILGLLPYVQSAISAIYSLILAIISPVGQLASVIIPLISQGLAFLFQVIASVGNTITGLIPYVQSAILGLLPYVQSAINSIYSLILAIISPVGQLASVIIPLISQGLAFGLQMVGSIANLITGLIPYVQAFVSTLVPYVQSAVGAIYTLVAGIVPIVGQLATFAIPLVGQGLAFVLQLVTAVATSITNLLPSTAFLDQLIKGVQPFLISSVNLINQLAAIILPVVLNSIIGIFGFVQNIVNGLLSSNALIQGLSLVVQSISQFTLLVFSSLQQSLGNIFSQSQGIANLGEIIGQFLGYALQLLAAIIPLVGSIFNVVFKIFEALVNITLLNPVFQAILKLLVDGIGLIFSGIGAIAGFLTNFLNSFADSLAGLNTYLTDLNNKFAAQYKEIADFILASIVGFFRAIGDGFLYLFQLIGQALNAVGEFFIYIGQGIIDTSNLIGQLFGFVFDFLKQSLELSTLFFKETYRLALSMFGYLWEMLSQSLLRIQNLFQNTWKFVSSLFSGITQTLSGLFDNINSWVFGVYEQLDKYVFSWVFEQLQALNKSLTELFDFVKSAIYNYVAKPFKEYVIDPTYQFIDKATNLAMGALNKVTDTIKNILKPALDLVAETSGKIGSVFASWSNPLQSAINSIGNVGSGVAGIFGGGSSGSTSTGTDSTGATSLSSPISGVPYGNVKRGSNEGIFSQSGFSQAGVDFVKAYEGFAPKAFWDYAQYSIGFGTKASSGNATITLEEANNELLKELIEARNFVKRLVPQANANQIAALTSFTFNTGPGSLQTLVRNRSLAEIADKILLYDKTTTGVRLPGLTSRRKAERQLFLTGSSGGGAATGAASSAIGGLGGGIASGIGGGIAGGIGNLFGGGNTSTSTTGGLKIYSGGRVVTDSRQVNLHHNNSGAYGGATINGKFERTRSGRLVKDLVLKNSQGSEAVPVSAVRAGIAKVGLDPRGYGNFVDLVDESGRILQRVAHGSKVLVKDGQRVQAGQGLIIQGNTGRSSGTHLHLEILPELFDEFFKGTQTGKFSGNAAISTSPSLVTQNAGNNYLAEYQKQLQAILNPTKVSTPTLPKVSTPTLPKVPTPTLPKVPTPTLPKVTTPTLPKVSTPTLPKVSAPTLPKVSAPTLPKVSAPTLPKVPTPTLPKVPTPTLPKVSTPTLPKVSTPTLPKVPTPTLPKVEVPKLPTPTLPKIEVPKVEVPKLPTPTLPKIEVPKVEVPKLPTPTPPKIEVPKVEVPKLPTPTLPKIEVPKVEVPKFPTPTLPKIEVPKLPIPTLPKVEIPKVPTPTLPKSEVPNLGESLKIPSVLESLPVSVPSQNLSISADSIAKVKSLLVDKAGFLSLSDLDSSLLQQLQKSQILPAGVIKSEELETLLSEGIQKLDSKESPGLSSINTTISDQAKSLLANLDKIGKITLQQRELISDLLDKTISSGQLPSLKDLSQPQLSSLYRAGILRTGTVGFGEGYLRGTQDIESSGIFARLTSSIPSNKRLDASVFLESISRSIDIQPLASGILDKIQSPLALSLDKDRIKAALRNITIDFRGVSKSDTTPLSVSPNQLSRVFDEELLPALTDAILSLIERQGIFEYRNRPF